MAMTFIGDLHGKYRQYERIISTCRNSIQVGDMGVGFFYGSLEWPRAAPNPSYDKMINGDHRFIRGNHDNPSVCRRHSQWIPDGHVEGDMMFVGGGLSIDRSQRTEGLDWWPDEELSTPELHTIVDLYIKTKPRIMVTHECPESVADIMMAISGRRKLDFPSRTRQALQSMFEIHQPDRWIYGHWHVSFDQVIEGTRFVCLNELEAREFET